MAPPRCITSARPSARPIFCSARPKISSARPQSLVSSNRPGGFARQIGCVQLVFAKQFAPRQWTHQLAGLPDAALDLRCVRYAAAPDGRALPASTFSVTILTNKECHWSWNHADVSLARALARAPSFQARAPRFLARAPGLIRLCQTAVATCIQPSRWLCFANVAARSPSLRSSSREWLRQLVGLIDAIHHCALGCLDAAWSMPLRSCLASTHTARTISDKAATGARRPDVALARALARAP